MRINYLECCFADSSRDYVDPYKNNSYQNDTYQYDSHQYNPYQHTSSDRCID